MGFVRALNAVAFRQAGRPVRTRLCLTHNLDSDEANQGGAALVTNYEEIMVDALRGFGWVEACLTSQWEAWSLVLMLHVAIHSAILPLLAWFDDVWLHRPPWCKPDSKLMLRQLASLLPNTT